MVSSMQQTKDLKMKIIDVYKAGEGYKKMCKCFQLAISTEWNAIKKWYLRTALEACLVLTYK